jgi:glycine hydroxymethyltransferase
MGGPFWGPDFAGQSPVPYADAVSFSTHKVLRGPRGGMILCRAELADRIDRAVFPFLLGGPMMQVIAAKAAALGEALRPEFGRYAEQVVANAVQELAALPALAVRGPAPVAETAAAVASLAARFPAYPRGQRRA